ncbi:MAG: hypothetical protein ACRD0K_31025 [Egibacteraceae bacterium]
MDPSTSAVLDFNGLDPYTKNRVSSRTWTANPLHVLQGQSRWPGPAGVGHDVEGFSTTRTYEVEVEVTLNEGLPCGPDRRRARARV